MIRGFVAVALIPIFLSLIGMAQGQQTSQSTVEINCPDSADYSPFPTLTPTLTGRQTSAPFGQGWQAHELRLALSFIRTSMSTDQQTGGSILICQFGESAELPGMDWHTAVQTVAPADFACTARERGFICARGGTGQAPNFRLIQPQPFVQPLPGSGRITITPR